MPAPRIASLGMYDPPWLHQANDALWTAIARRLRAAGLTEVPARLQRDRPLAEIWRDPHLLLTQTCGYPLRTLLRGRVKVVATPCYATPHSRGARYRSVLVVHRDTDWTALSQLRGKRVAVNDMHSHSGMNLLRAAVAPVAAGASFFSELRISGSHLQSLAMVATAQVELAAIDGVSFALAATHRPDLVADVRILLRSVESPGLPLITHRSMGTAELSLLRATLGEVAADPALAGIRASLALRGFRQLPAGAYGQVLALERRAAKLGYPRLS